MTLPRFPLHLIEQVLAVGASDVAGRQPSGGGIDKPTDAVSVFAPARTLGGLFPVDLSSVA